MMWGIIFGSFGFGYFSYGKKRSALVPLFVGVALMVFPYFVSNAYLVVLVGIGLMALPYFIRI